MDINAALIRMRELGKAVDNCDATDRGKMADLLVDMAVVFEAIDGWLSKGGFLPDAWAWIRDAKTN